MLHHQFHNPSNLVVVALPPQPLVRTASSLASSKAMVTNPYALLHYLTNMILISPRARLVACLTCSSVALTIVVGLLIRCTATSAIRICQLDQVAVDSRVLLAEAEAAILAITPHKCPILRTTLSVVSQTVEGCPLTLVVVSKYLDSKDHPVLDRATRR